jgi:polysaccharide export outer membrane protein
LNKGAVTLTIFGAIFCFMAGFADMIAAQPQQQPQTVQEQKAPPPAIPAATQPEKQMPAKEESKEALKKVQSRAAIVADSSSYVIGPEDVLFIYVWKEEQLTKTVPVRMDGMISIPLIDDIKAAGMTPLQLKNILSEKFEEYVDNPDVTVVVMEANSFKVYLQGEVKNPGVIRLRTETSLVQLIIMAGGFTDWANQKKITVIRKEGGKDTRVMVNYKKIVDGDEDAKDVILKSGDIIIVPN